MAPEWASTAVPEPDSIWQGSCLGSCILPLQYGLLCRHWMLKSFLDSFPLPLSLVHPHWWLSGSPMHVGGWTVGYYHAAIDPQERWVGGYRNRGKDTAMESVHNLLGSQSQLLPEQSERLMRQMVADTNQLPAEAHALEEMEHQIPSQLPPSLPPDLSLQAK
jgi:hypothetical protein